MLTSIEFEYPACPLCQTTQRKVVYDRFGANKIVRCSKCYFHYLYPRLTENASRCLYTNDKYFEGGDAGYSNVNYALQEPTLRTTFKQLMHNLKKRDITGGSLLEIGCGYGYLLDEAREFFAYRVGTELSPKGVELASTRADKIYHGGAEQLPADSKFDCIIATHVIEHIYEPIKFVKLLTKHSHPETKIVLATPDVGGLLKKLMGSRWPSFKMPEHVLYFDAASLSRLMRQAGLKGLQRLPYPHAFPLSLIASKLDLPLPNALGNVNIWVPATTVAFYGTVSDD